MPFRLTPALCVLVLTGCATPEPQNVAYAPSAAFMPAPPPVGPSVPALHDQPANVATDDMSAAPAPQPGCSTVDGVTLCDAPYDPDADDTLYTN